MKKNTNIRRKTKKTFSICFIIFFVFQLSFAENFRVRQNHCADFSTNTQSQTAKLGFNDSFSIILPKNNEFLEGLELEFKIPQELLQYKHCVGYAFYHKLSPTPSSENIDYNGTQLFIDTLPARLSMVVQIPVNENLKIEESPFAAILPSMVLGNDDVIFLRLLPIMKGLPDNIEDLVFEITAKPILSSQGILNLSLTFPEENPKEVAVFIDEKPVSSIKEPIRLEEGIHYLAVTSENYRTEVRTFSVERGKTSNLSVNLRDTTPELIVSAPANTKVLLDGEVFAWDKGTATILPGEHTLKFVLADYEVTKTFNAINGKTYNMALTIDIQYNETP